MTGSNIICWFFFFFFLHANIKTAASSKTKSGLKMHNWLQRNITTPQIYVWWWFINTEKYQRNVNRQHFSHITETSPLRHFAYIQSIQSRQICLCICTAPPILFALQTSVFQRRFRWDSFFAGLADAPWPCQPFSPLHVSSAYDWIHWCISVNAVFP